ncbi:hypothetical protein V6N13_073033 [Hibiscus sabdariffa]|uniref:Uncharacterized protein n=1 Tax=Hibiscus sabdariffa TaxID=183260 RepID=A0ABR2E8A8_9ROSI
MRSGSSWLWKGIVRVWMDVRESIIWNLSDQEAQRIKIFLRLLCQDRIVFNKERVRGHMADDVNCSLNRMIFDPENMEGASWGTST